MKNKLSYKQYSKEELSLRDLLAMDRTVLANERNILSFIRSFFSFIITGLALIRFFPAWNRMAFFLFFLGVLILLIGIKKYVGLRKDLKNILKD